jgi:uncharacterized membrane protein YphA (DoxX/SURF4 family)
MTVDWRKSLAGAAPFLRFLPGVVLLAAGYAKAVRPPEEFAASLEAYWILPLSLVLPLARIVPWVELLTGLALLSGYGIRRAAVMGALLHGAFVFFLGQAQVRSLTLKECGCFGSLGPRLSPGQAIAMDALLLGVCVLVALDRERRWTLDRWTEIP